MTTMKHTWRKALARLSALAGFWRLYSLQGFFGNIRHSRSDINIVIDLIGAWNGGLPTTFMGLKSGERLPDLILETMML